MEENESTAAGRVKGSCHCGAVQISVVSAPTAVTECHCSICQRYGTLWSYYRCEDMSLTGPTQIYERGRKAIAFHRCVTCGCVMAWTPNIDHPECGVNARMLDGFDLAKVNHIIEEDASG